MSRPQTFGEFVSQARKAKGMTQKQLTEKIKREDGDPISPQYMNDIEHDRRLPSSEIILQLASVLELSPDYLHFLAGKWPGDISPGKANQKDVEKLMVAFRKQLVR